ncbi:MAG TPA: GNAT family N-acetyltransferase [Microthrixaceae bacterium]|nr:GNAT family N-acetyltransferase [Microthrixaceae bacterium]HNI34663.1 GNAT family N-acetyltransferase [Microthrixaceae bacterium]
MSDSYSVRSATDPDVERLVELNNAAVPAVSHADERRMAQLVQWSSLTWVATDGAGDVVGFVILIEPGSTYDSQNYAWFAERFSRFLYVDRVVVSDEHRGSGLGSRLYEAVIAEGGRRGSERVAAEVNLVPPNPGSARFHRRHGFEAVGEQRFADDYAVEMLVRPV